MTTFTQALLQARRKAALAGRPLSAAETSGIASGYAAQASERAAEGRKITVQEETLGLERKRLASEEAEAEKERLLEAELQEERLAQEAAIEAEKVRFSEEQLEEQERANLAQEEISKSSLITQERIARESREAAERTAEMQTIGTTVGTGATIGATIGMGAAYGSWGGPIGAGIGAFVGLGVGLAANASHLCTESQKVLGFVLDLPHQTAFDALREYCHSHHPRGYKFYLEHGPEIIEGIRNRHNRSPMYSEWWEQFYRNIIRPMLMANAQDTGPYLEYVVHVKDVLIPTYAPHLVEGAEGAWLADRLGEEEVE